MIRIKSLSGRAFWALGQRIYTGDTNWRPVDIWHPFELPRRGSHAFLAAYEDGKLSGRLLCGVDEGYISRTGERQGYLSMLDLAPGREAAFRLLDAARDFWKAQGAEYAFGPRPPIYADLGVGVLTEGFAGRPSLFNVYNTPCCAEYLEEYGFEKALRHYAFRFDLENAPYARYAQAASWAQARYGLHVEKMDARAHPRKAGETLLHVLNEGDLDGYFRLIARMKRYFAPDLFLVAKKGEEPVGVLLALPDEENGMRVVTLGAAKEWRNGAVSTLLLDAIMQAARKRRVVWAEASTVREDNLASISAIEKLGGRVERVYSQYILRV